MSQKTVILAGDPAFAEAWQRLWIADGMQNPLHQPAHSQYYREYSGAGAVDCSAVFLHEGRPVLGLQMAEIPNRDGAELSWLGRPVLLLQDRSLDASVRQKTGKDMKAWFCEQLEQRRIQRMHFRDYLADGELSYFGRLLLDLGGHAEPYFTQIVDLSAGIEVLWRTVAKGSRWGINWGRNNMTLSVLDRSNVSAADMEAFRALHIEAAGRETRSRLSWEMQLEMIQQSEAFMVFGVLDGALVSGALFSLSPRSCIYGVSASRRDLFDKPISHAVVWAGIEHAARIGCIEFELGKQVFPGQDADRLSKKELDISNFKRWFGGSCHVRLDLKWSRSTPASASVPESETSR